MDRFVERSYARAVSSTPPAGDAAPGTAKMAAALHTEESPQAHAAPDTQANDPASPADIAHQVVALLGPTLAATVDAAVQRGLEQLHLEVQSQAQRIAQTEDRISSLEDDSTAQSAILARITAENRELWSKLDDLENRSRRNNMRIIGLPESVTNNQLANICAKVIPEQLGLRIPCAVERAHRIGQYMESRTKPRHVIVKYLNYADKTAIMQAFRRTRSLSLDGSKLLLFADYSIEVMKQRKAFSAICTTLHRDQVKFSLGYPATLRIQTKSGEHLTFSSPEEADRYLASADAGMDHTNSAEDSSSSPATSSTSRKQPGSPIKQPYKRSRVAHRTDPSNSH